MKSYGPPHHVYSVSLPYANNFIRIDTTLSINTNVTYLMCFYKNLYCQFACNLQETESLIKKSAYFKIHLIPHIFPPTHVNLFKRLASGFM